MTETFKLSVKVGASGDTSLGVTTVQFGDGYKSKMPNGINNEISTWSVSKTGNEKELSLFLAFLKRHEGAKAFYWTPPLESEGLFTADKWKTATHGKGIFTISTDFERAYSAGSTSQAGSESGTSVMINDNVTVKDKTWSSTKIAAEINKASGQDGTGVASVNNVKPDKAGNVALVPSDIKAEKEGTAKELLGALKQEADPFPVYAKTTDITALDVDIESIQTELTDLNELSTDVLNELGTVSDELHTLADGLAVTVKSVNNIKPDAQGNVKIETGTKGVEIDDKNSSNKTVYSSQKTEQVIDNKLTELANSDDENKGAGCIGFNEALAYPTNSVGGALHKLADQIDSSGVPLFTTSWWPSRTNIPAGYVAADGHELPHATYPEAAQAITDNKVPTVSDSVWLSNPSTRGCYVSVSSEGHFRLPDYNGMQTDSLGALFVRGGNRGVADGVIQGDAIRNIVGDYGSILKSNGSANGPFELKNSGTYLWQIGQSGTSGGGFSFDASRVVPTAEENRPINVTGCWIIKLFGAVVNVGSADAAQLATDYANLTSRIIVLESIQQQKRFTIIYPNSGTESNPATILSNKRYIEDNPFPNNPVICKAEVLVNDTWGSVEWLFSNGGAGVTANHLTESDKIIVQTGSKAVVANSSASGGATGYYGNDLTTAPCRVKVWRIM